MDFIKPMEPIRTENIINDDKWIHEIKWDGIRGLTYYINKDLRIYTKRGNLRSEYYPEMKEIKDLINCNEVIFDGEMVVFDEENRPSFQEILARDRSRGRNLKYNRSRYPIKYIIFDILFKDGVDLRNLDLKKRKDILKDSIRSSSIITVTDSFNDGNSLYKLMRSKNYEGIVSKKLTSSYISGKKHNDWYKVKISRQILAVIGGVNIKDNTPSSLLVGIYKNKELIYIGSVATGLNQSDLTIINQYRSTFKQDISPFSNVNVGKNVEWFKPLLTCWIHFSEWTNEGRLRHPKIIGFSSDTPDKADGKEYVD